MCFYTQQAKLWQLKASWISMLREYSTKLSCYYDIWLKLRESSDEQMKLLNTQLQTLTEEKLQLVNVLSSKSQMTDLLKQQVCFSLPKQFFFQFPSFLCKFTPNLSSNDKYLSRFITSWNFLSWIYCGYAFNFLALMKQHCTASTLNIRRFVLYQFCVNQTTRVHGEKIGHVMPLLVGC